MKKGSGMKKTLIFVTNISSLLIIAHVCQTLDALTAFFIAGVVPGTGYSLSPVVMLSALLLISIALVVAGMRVLTPETAQKVLPKKRYSRL